MPKLGRKRNAFMDAPVTHSSSEEFPKLRLNSKNFPHLMKSGVNKSVKMNISGKVRSINPSYDRPGTHDIELDVTHATHKKKGWQKHMEG